MENNKPKWESTKFGREIFIITPLLCTCTVNSGLVPHCVQNSHLKPNVRTLQGVFLKQGAMKRGFLISRGIIIILKVSCDSSVFPWFNCAAGAGIFHGNLNHLEATLPSQHIESSSGCHHQKMWAGFGISKKWLVQQTAFQNLRKPNIPYCLLPHLSGSKPTLIFYSNNLYPCFLWGNKMGRKKLILCQSKLRRCNWLRRGQQPLVFPAADTLKIYTLCVCLLGVVGTIPSCAYPKSDPSNDTSQKLAAHHPHHGPAVTWAAQHMCMHDWGWIAWHFLTMHIIKTL